MLPFFVLNHKLIVIARNEAIASRKAANFAACDCRTRSSLAMTYIEAHESKRP
jgi:hypothetical protein